MYVVIIIVCTGQAQSSYQKSYLIRIMMPCRLEAIMVQCIPCQILLKQVCMLALGFRVHAVILLQLGF